MVKKGKKTISVISLVLIILGLLITYGSHIMIISMGIAENLLVPHAVLNLLASAFITIGVLGLFWRITLK